MKRRSDNELRQAYAGLTMSPDLIGNSCGSGPKEAEMREQGGVLVFQPREDSDEILDPEVQYCWAYMH